MKNKLQSSLIIILLLISSSAWTQSQLFDYITEINSHMNDIPYVFEGQIQSVEIYAGDEHGNKLPSSSVDWNGEVGYFYMPNGKRGYGYSLTTIKVCKVYKGDLPNEFGDHTFKVLTRSDAINNVYQAQDPDDVTDITDHFTYKPATHLGYAEEPVFLPAQEYPRTIFFCDRIDNIVPVDYEGQYYYSNFHSVYELPFDVPVDIPQSNGFYTRTDAYAMLFTHVFTGPDEMEQFLALIDGVDPTPPDFCGARPAKPIVKIEEEEIKVDYAQNLKNYNDRMTFLNNRILNSPTPAKKSSAIYDLNLDMANERLVKIGSNTWYEFDIMVSSNDNTIFFDNLLMRIQYNTSAFGSNIMSNSNVVITRATGYNTSTYSDPQTNSIDQTSSVIGIPFGTDFNVMAWNRVQHTLSPHKMMTIRFKIANCNQNVNLSFVDQPTTSNLSFFATTANANIVNAIGFDNTYYTGNITDKTCEPIITNFSNNVPAGIGRHMVINGKYFGNVKGTGTVIFKNADKGTVYPLFQGTNSSGIQAFDVVSWADNKILLTLPSIIDSAYVTEMINNIPTPTGPKAITPGSGKFMVKNFTGNMKESASPVTITFAHSNVIVSNIPYNKTKIRLSSNTSYGYRVQFDPAVVTWDSDAKAVFRKSMKNWSCATGINWYYGPDTNMVAADFDYRNYITFGNITSIMRTRPSISSCVSGNVHTPFLQSFDIQIKQNPPFPWQVDTTGILVASYHDFYASAQHELGHAHLLDHINDSIYDVMWWASYAYATNQSTRKHVWTSPGGVDGGNHVADSLVGGLGCVGNHLIVLPNNCMGFAYGIKELNANLLNLSVYPNPSAVYEAININFDLTKEQMVSFNLYGITGNLVKSTPPELLRENVNYQFTTENVSPGMYLLQINVGNKRQTVKVIKQ